MKDQLPKKCKDPVDRDIYARFFNVQCDGYPDFPVNFTTSATSGSPGRTETRLAGWVVFAIGMGTISLL
jgi:hypothetical protein